MSMTLKDLTKALSGSTYQPKEEEELLEAARNRYAAEYGEKRLAARQAYENTDAALDELAARNAAGYEEQIARMAEGTRKSVSEAERAALAKGMQRSSYNAMGQANIRAAGENGIAALRQSLLNEQSSLQAQRARLAGQLADTLAQYDISFSQDVQAYLDQLRDQEYERQDAAKRYADKISMALYEYGLKAGGGYSGGTAKKSASGKKAKAETETAAPVVKNTAADTRNNVIKKSANAAGAGVNALVQRLQDSLKGFSKR